MTASGQLISFIVNECGWLFSIRFEVSGSSHCLPFRMHIVCAFVVFFCLHLLPVQRTIGAKENEHWIYFQGYWLPVIVCVQKSCFCFVGQRVGKSPMQLLLDSHETAPFNQRRVLYNLMAISGLYIGKWMEDVSFENARDQKVSVDTLQNIINDCGATHWFENLYNLVEDEKT